MLVVVVMVIPIVVVIVMIVVMVVMIVVMVVMMIVVLIPILVVVFAIVVVVMISVFVIPVAAPRMSYMMGHTGGVMSVGTGVIHGKSYKQKLNTRSTTESELVGVSEYLPYDLWQVNFYKYQG
jgi:hypothetical protein